MPARLVRSQMVARHMHRNLTQVFDNVSQIPVSSSPPNGVLGNTKGQLPTGGHKQRLLREINDLIPRVEQLAARLTKRPPKRRPRHFIDANPWGSYLGSARRDETGWRCVLCGAINPPDENASECSSCKSSAARGLTEQALATLPQDSEKLRQRLRETFNNSSIPTLPWIFAPAADLLRSKKRISPKPPSDVQQPQTVPKPLAQQISPTLAPPFISDLFLEVQKHQQFQQPHRHNPRFPVELPAVSNPAFIWDLICRGERGIRCLPL